MPKIKRAASPFDVFDDDFDEDASSSSSKNGNPPIQRNAANARERARMRVLSSAFGRLKTKLPNIPPDTKLSKLDTLRLATIYIKQLKTLLEGGDETMDIEPLTFHHTPQSMTWPFTFQHIQASRQLTPHYAPMEWSQPDKYSNDPYRNHNNNNSSIMNNNHISNSSSSISSSNNNNNNNQHSLSNTIQSHSSCLYDHSSHGHVIH